MINYSPEELTRYIMMLRTKGIQDQRVLHAMELIPRKAFISNAFHDRTLLDTALPIASGQTLSQPSIVGTMTQALEAGPRHKVLEIGTGSGFQSAILSQLARRVYTVERFVNLARTATRRFDKLGLVNITVIIGDGYKGLPHQAPFDRIIVTAAAEDPPSQLLDQLKDKGIMVIPVGQSNNIQTLIKITKNGTMLDYKELGNVRFVPLVEGIIR